MAYLFCKKSHMIVNERKTKVMVFGSYNHVPTFNYNDNILEVVSKYKYLGILFNTIKRYNGEIFKEHLVYSSSQASKLCLKY